MPTASTTKRTMDLVGVSGHGQREVQGHRRRAKKTPSTRCATTAIRTTSESQRRPQFGRRVAGDVQPGATKPSEKPPKMPTSR